MVVGENWEERESGHEVETAAPQIVAVAGAALAAVAVVVVGDVVATGLAAVAEELAVVSRSAGRPVEQKFAEVAAVLAAVSFAPVELAPSG